jgi:NAD(P)-dependent dehydrogenase (short-subunit alcohol dehydrogenase family)
MHWSSEEMPEQTGRTALVTGANSGLGYQTTLALAGKGARVVMACRDEDRAKEAREEILRSLPGADLELLIVDLASLDSIRDASGAYLARHSRLDMLINSAGIMAPPRTETQDGFELQFGVNHLGHFALTGQLLPRLLRTPKSRVVTVTSTAHKFARIDFEDLQSRRSYRRYRAYGQSKLANVLFAFELNRRFSAAGSESISAAAHPGLAETTLQERTARSSASRFEGAVYTAMHYTISQSAEMGALPQLYAATAEDAEGGMLYGPEWLQTRGFPVQVRPSRAATSWEDARRLWEISEELTGVSFGLPMPPMWSRERRRGQA